MGGTPESQAMYLKYQHLSQQRYRYFKNLVRIAPYAIGAGTAATTAIMGGLRGKRSIDVNDGATSSSSNNKQARFEQDQNQKTTYGKTNAAFTRKVGANFLVIKQHGAWNPYPRDNRSLLYKIINPRFSINKSIAASAKLITVNSPGNATYFNTNLTLSDIKGVKQALSLLVTTSATDPRGHALLPALDNTITSTETGMPKLIDSEFTIVQWQTKYLVKNKCSFNCNITIWDFVSERDSVGNTPSQCYADYLAAQGTLGTSQLTNIATPLMVGPFTVSTLQTNSVQSVSSFADAGKYTRPFWRTLKKTTMVLEPGGVFEYIQSMYNVKLSNYLAHRFDTAGVTCIQGKTRSIYMEFQGQMISAPINGMTYITHGDASLLVEQFDNITAQNMFGIKNNRMIAWNTTRGSYFTRANPNTIQSVTNIDGDAAVVFENNL